MKTLSGTLKELELYYMGTEAIAVSGKGIDMAPRPGKDWDDENFSDIWDTNRGRGKRDKSTVWGTDEYFQRYGKSRDEWDTRQWDTGQEDFSGVTRRIRQNIEDSKRKLKFDAEKIRQDARRAAEKVRQDAARINKSTRIAAQKKLFKNHNFTSQSQPKKKKRRIKLSGKSGVIGLGGIIFWGIMLFSFCDDDKAEKTAKVVNTSTDNEIVQQVKESYDSLKPEVQALVDKAKSEYERVIVMDGKTTVVINDETSNNSDPYKQSDDKYESIEDKW